MEERESFRRRRLPHWDVPAAAYFVTTCLAGSIPARGLLDLAQYRQPLAQRFRPAHIDAHVWDRQQAKLSFARLDWWLDQEPAARLLQDDALAKIVADALFFFAGDRYDLLAYVVMPSHFHWVFQPRDDWVKTLESTVRFRSARERIEHSINRHTLSECNRIRGAQGDFWQRESYDHWVRDSDERERIIHYIENNPVKAGFVEHPAQWVYSSAHDREKLGLEFGAPLLRRSQTAR